MMKTTQILSILLAMSSFVVAQTKLTGTVTDNTGESLIGANVFIEGTYDGISTDINGKYNLTSSKSGVIVLTVSYMGYEDSKQNIMLNGTPLTTNFTLKESINRLTAVVISAGTFEAGSGTKSEVLKPLDIVTTAGATADIAGALNSLPGTQKVGEEGRLFVRGGSGSETKTFIDGLQVLKPYGTTIPNTPTRGRFSPFMFSGTSFSTGGYSAEYGQALSSALILNTKEKPTQTRTDLSIMTVGTEVSHTHSLPRSSVAIQGAYYNLKPYFNVVNQTTDWINEPSSYLGSLAARRMIGRSGILKVYSNVSTNRFSMYQHDIIDPTNKNLIEIENSYVYINTSLKNTINDSWSYNTGISYTSNTDFITQNNQNIKEDTRGAHIKATLNGEITNWLSINTGGEFLFSSSERDYVRKSDGFEDFSQYINPLVAGFAETDIYFSNNLLARVGARMEYTSMNNQFYVAPRVSLAYKTGEYSQIALASGRFQQATTDEFLRVNSALDFEKADHLILNYQFVSANQTFRIEGYLKQYQDLVKFNAADQFNSAAYTNDGSGMAKGIDLFWRDNKTIKNVDYWISYSYLDTKRDYRDYPTKVRPSYASKHNLSIVYKHFVPKLKTQLSGTFSYASARSYNNPNSGIFNGEFTPDYIDLSLSISYLATQRIIVYGSVTNVLGRKNVFGYTYSENLNNEGVYERSANTLPAPRFLFLGVFITFSKDATLNQLKSL